MIARECRKWLHQGIGEALAKPEVRAMILAVCPIQSPGDQARCDAALTKMAEEHLKYGPDGAQPDDENQLTLEEEWKNGE